MSDIKAVKTEEEKSIKGIFLQKKKVCSYCKHLILTAPIDDSTRGWVEGVEWLEPSAFLVISITLHCHDLHVHSIVGKLLLHKSDQFSFLPKSDTQAPGR